MGNIEFSKKDAQIYYDRFGEYPVGYKPPKGEKPSAPRKPGLKEIGIAQMLQSGQINTAQAESLRADFKLGTERKKKTANEIYLEGLANAEKATKHALFLRETGVIDSLQYEEAKDTIETMVPVSGRKVKFKPMIRIGGKKMTPQEAGLQKALPKVQSIDEYNMVAPGTEYLDPRGNLRIKK